MKSEDHMRQVFMQWVLRKWISYQ